MTADGLLATRAGCMFGFINVSKPSGKTSRQVVDRVVRCAAGAKAGHAGTLDPLASGVLVVAVGPATRLISLRPANAQAL